MGEIRSEEELFRMYPDVFKFALYSEDEYQEEFGEFPPQITSYGIQCGKGWYKLVKQAADILSDHHLREDTEQEEDNRNEAPKMIQVKEKFGRLRIYTTGSDLTPFNQLQMIENLSEDVCEYCGQTRGVQQVPLDGIRLKSVCRDCHIEEEDISSLQLVEFDHECFNCGEKVRVQYPNPLGNSTKGGDWGLFAPYLNEIEESSLKRIYSETQNNWVWGNQCGSCSAYIGNYYVREAYKNSPENTEKICSIQLE